LGFVKDLPGMMFDFLGLYKRNPGKSFNAAVHFHPYCELTFHRITREIEFSAAVH
jgi:hypothetical protein